MRIDDCGVGRARAASWRAADLGAARRLPVDAKLRTRLVAAIDGVAGAAGAGAAGAAAADRFVELRNRDATGLALRLVLRAARKAASAAARSAGVSAAAGRRMTRKPDGVCLVGEEATGSAAGAGLLTGLVACLRRLFLTDDRGWPARGLAFRAACLREAERNLEATALRLRRFLPVDGGGAAAAAANETSIDASYDRSRSGMDEIDESHESAARAGVLNDRNDEAIGVLFTTRRGVGGSASKSTTGAAP